MKNQLLSSIIGRIRSPRYAQLTLVVHEGKLRVLFQAQDSPDSTPIEFRRECETDLIEGETIIEILQWLKYTHTKFYGGSKT